MPPEVPWMFLMLLMMDGDTGRLFFLKLLTNMPQSSDFELALAAWLPLGIRGNKTANAVQKLPLE